MRGKGTKGKKRKFPLNALKLPWLQGFIWLCQPTIVGSQGFIFRAMLQAFSLSNPRDSLLPYTILLADATFIPLFFKQSFTESVQLFLGRPT